MPPLPETPRLRPDKGPAADVCAADELDSEAAANCDQAASCPDALATWVAIASIKGGERQS